MTKVVGVTALHYGKDFLSYAIRSVIDAVDEHHILYSPRGSHGHHTDAVCPDTRDELYALAEYSAGRKLRWHEGTWGQEGEQRDTIFRLAPDATAVLTVDADEVYEEGLAEQAVRYAVDSGVHRLRLPFIHLWRSFYRGFRHDPAYPERVVIPARKGGETDTFDTDLRVWHFGYAQRSELVRYKMLTHGHRNQFRTDVDWFDEVFMTNRQTDCHPVGSEYWNTEAVALSELPVILWRHPYARMDVIP